MKFCTLSAVSLVLAAAPAFAGVLPAVIGPWKQVSATPLEITSDRALWDEYGLAASEQGDFAQGDRKMHVRVWRVADSTAAFGAFEYLRPAEARPAPKFTELTPLAVLTPQGALVALGNYVARFEGNVPDPDASANLFRSMPRFERAPLPAFVDHMPTGAAPNSERYIGGPAALKRFLPGMEPSVAAFHLGAEAAVADYPAGRLALFSYPTPEIARSRTEALRKIDGAVVKRAGPLVGVVLRPADVNGVEHLLAKVRYEAAVTTGEKPRTRKDNPANFFLNVFFLVCIIAGFCILSGVLFGVARIVFRRAGPGRDGEDFLALHLEQR